MQIDTKWVNGTDDLLVTAVSERRKWWLFGPKVERVRRYRGSCTVWHEYPSGERCDTDTEWWLCEIWHKAKWSKEDSLHWGRSPEIVSPPPPPSE